MRRVNKGSYPKDWKKISRSTIIKRGLVCQLCRLSYPQIPLLTVHHKDFNPSNNDPSNLVVCCPRCHFNIQLHNFSDPEQLEFTYKNEKTSFPTVPTQKNPL